MKNKSLETCLVLSVAFAILFYFFRNENLLLISILIGLIGILFPWLAEKLTLGWLKFSELLGGVMSKVLLSLVFAIVLVPISLLYRLVKRKENLLNLSKKENTYWEEVSKTFPKENFKKIW